MRPVPAKQQPVEVAAAVRLKAANLPVQYDVPRPYTVGDFLRELWPGLEHVPVPRHQLAAMPLHARERTEPVNLRLEDECRMVERLRDAQQAHRRGEDRHG